MTYWTVNGKLVKRERLKRREPKREDIKTEYCHELWRDGPVRTAARMIARQELKRKIKLEGRDLNTVSSAELGRGVFLLLYNSGDVYLHKAKEWLR